MIYHLQSQKDPDPLEPNPYDRGVCVMAESAAKAMGLSAPSDKKTPAADASANPFTDVSETSPFYDAILWAVKQKITNGKTASTFGPGDTCTVSHILTFLYRAYAINNGIETTGPEREAVLAWAKENQMIQDTKNLDIPCTRAMAMTFIWRAFDSPKRSVTFSFDDIPEDAEYTQAVLWAVEHKITSGTGDGTTFSPEDSCTRGQIATFLYRAYK